MPVHDLHEDPVGMGGNVNQFEAHSRPLHVPPDLLQNEGSREIDAAQSLEIEDDPPGLPRLGQVALQGLFQDGGRPEPEDPLQL